MLGFSSIALDPQFFTIVFLNFYLLMVIYFEREGRGEREREVGTEREEENH